MIVAFLAGLVALVTLLYLSNSLPYVSPLFDELPFAFCHGFNVTSLRDDFSASSLRSVRYPLFRTPIVQLLYPRRPCSLPFSALRLRVCSALGGDAVSKIFAILSAGTFFRGFQVDPRTINLLSATTSRLPPYCCLPWKTGCISVFVRTVKLALNVAFPFTPLRPPSCPVRLSPVRGPAPR